MRRAAALLSFFVSFLLLTNGAALAQTKTPASPPSQSCAPPGQSGMDKSGKPLNERLSDSKGVICPPPTQDSGTVPPPDSGGRMPVIKPPPDAK